MDSWQLQARRAGKSRAANQAKEAALNAGRDVILVSADGATKFRRRKHLTMIERVAPKSTPTWTITDDIEGESDER